MGCFFFTPMLLPLCSYAEEIHIEENVVSFSSKDSGPNDIFETPSTGRSPESGTARSTGALTSVYFLLLNLTDGIAPEPDTDGDGISDSDENTIYGTDPNRADTDADGIDDGGELIYWGADWDSDPDGDGTVNILDADSDNDGSADGQEIADGTDPADPFSYPLMEIDFGLSVDEQQGGGGLLGERTNRECGPQHRGVPHSRR